MRAHAMILDEAIGLSPSKSEAENVEAMARYFDLKDRDSGLAKRQQVDKALEHLDVEFYAHGAEVGWFYDFDYIGTYGANAKNQNPQVKQDGDMELCTYYETTRPGSQFAHSWLRHVDNDKRLSSRELASKDTLLLITMSPRWKHLEHPLIKVKILQSHGGYLLDDEGRLKELWQREGLSDTAALLVRPDNIIAYRFLDDDILTTFDYQSEVQQIIQTVLGFERSLVRE